MEKVLALQRISEEGYAGAADSNASCGSCQSAGCCSSLSWSCQSTTPGTNFAA